MSNTQGNLVNVAAKNQEPQPQVNTVNNKPPEEQTNWVTVDMEDPIAKEEAANFNPLRTAVVWESQTASQAVILKLRTMFRPT